jgi:hypothetical protein
MTSYSNDEPAFWRSLRRELVRDGYSSRKIHEYKNLILEYVRELGPRGVLDDQVGRSLMSLSTSYLATLAPTQIVDNGIDPQQSSSLQIDGGTGGQKPKPARNATSCPRLNSSTLSSDVIQSDLLLDSNRIHAARISNYSCLKMKNLGSLQVGKEGQRRHQIRKSHTSYLLLPRNWKRAVAIQISSRSRMIKIQRWVYLDHTR